MDDYEKYCEYCKEKVSVFNSLTEFGKHYHQNCMVQKLHKELEGYKKKYLDGKMTKGDKTIFLDTFTLSKKLMAKPTTQFHGWMPIEERKHERISTEKCMIVDEQFRPILDNEGKPKFEDNIKGHSMTTLIMRPDVRGTEKSRKLLSAPKKQKTPSLGDIPKLMEQI